MSLFVFPPSQVTVSGGATEVTLAALNAKFNSLGQKTMANSAPFVIASDQSAIPVTMAAVPTGAATEVTLAALNAKFSALGQNTMAASAPVVISSDQSAIPSSQSGTWNITNISGTVSLPTGASTEATLSTLNGKIPANLTVISTRLLVDGSGVTQPVSAASLPLPTGASTEATLAAISGQLPTSLGAQSIASSLSITPATSSTWTISNPAQTLEYGSVTNLTTTAQTFSKPSGSFGVMVQADDTNTANIRVAAGVTATASVGFQLQPGRSESWDGASDLSVFAESGTNQKIYFMWYKR